MLPADELEDSEDNYSYQTKEKGKLQVKPVMCRRNKKIIVEHLESNGIFRAPDLSVIVVGSAAAKIMGTFHSNLFQF
ncbi:hypothetical protein V1478_002212 [Vespula squamosa]|uniref:Uncharacterized protein n=1 Tax=Vespula squamosa TaxID=30214 RepID=A0ABD2BW59_VESSQ